MTERRVCIICKEHRADHGDFCARCWAEFADDIQRDAPWIAELREDDQRHRNARARAARRTRRGKQE